MLRRCGGLRRVDVPGRAGHYAALMASQRRMWTAVALAAVALLAGCTGGAGVAGTHSAASAPSSVAAASSPVSGSAPASRRSGSVAASAVPTGSSSAAAPVRRGVPAVRLVKGLAGMPPVTDTRNVYAAAGVGMIPAREHGYPAYAYVPHNKSGDVWVSTSAPIKSFASARSASRSSMWCRPTT